ncbi:MAG: hypothetical protein AAB655_00305 [Patescibacteria group bacterium]
MKSPFSAFVIITLVALFAGAVYYLFFSSGEEYLGKQLTLPGGKIYSASNCIDSDENLGSEAYYNKGGVSEKLPDGTRATTYDYCSGSEGQVSEQVCKSSLGGNGKLTRSQNISNCPYGCSDGACLKSPVSANTAKSSYLEPIGWTDGNAKFEVTGAELGKISAPPNLVSYEKGVSYPQGSEINALVLTLRVMTDKSGCVPLDTRRVLDEAGNMVSPNTKSFSFPDSGGCFAKEKTTYSNQRVIFVVPESMSDFIISTGGQEDIYIEVVLENNSLRILNLSQPVPGN